MPLQFLLPNIASLNSYSLYHPFQSEPTAPESFAPEKVDNFLSMLDSDSATGPDSISSCFLKTCFPALAHPVSALFTLSLSLCHRTSAWKSANITALHKNVKTLIILTTDPSDYFQSSARSWNPSLQLILLRIWKP